jgi:hypothetical protein
VTGFKSSDGVLRIPAEDLVQISRFQRRDDGHVLTSAARGGALSIGYARVAVIGAGPASNRATQRHSRRSASGEPSRPPTIRSRRGIPRITHLVATADWSFGRYRPRSTVSRIDGEGKTEPRSTTADQRPSAAAVW